MAKDRTTDPAKWSSGNEVAYGALVVGSTNNANGSMYNAHAVVNMTGGSLTCTTNIVDLQGYTNALYAVRLGETTFETRVTLSGTTLAGASVNHNNTATIEKS